MERLSHKGYKIPKKEVVKAIFNWIKVSIPYGIGWALTFPMGILVALTSKHQTFHPQGEPTTDTHSVKYKAAGSSGSWEYWNSPYKLLKPWNNYEDGTLGEPSGKHSARVGGEERSVWNQYMWTIRNPFNYTKRSVPLFFCPVNDCKIEYWGDFEISDTREGAEGWHFCKATHMTTGKTWYWYRSVKSAGEGKVRVAAIGYKIRPGHALEVQDKDDEDKAFTVRLPVKTNIN